MTKSELIHRIAHKHPQLVERDITLAVRVIAGAQVSSVGA